MKTLAILQARLRSTRLPAKVLLDLCGATVLQRCLDRVARIQGVDEIVVATSTAPENELICMLAKRLGYKCVRGSEKDVLSRYYDAATAAKADVVMRCTADCPLLDPKASSLVVRTFLESQKTGEPLDYASNTLERRLPRGLDTEVVSMAALTRAHEEAVVDAEREHVTMYVYRRPVEFRCRKVLADLPRDLSHHRWTLDTLEDYHFLAKLYEALGPEAGAAGMEDVLAVLERHPEIVAINAHVAQKSTAPA
jgi:spore coat polysaccharide biosynthesis protein SpsF